MNYEVSFRNAEGQYVGDLWVSHTTESANLIKEVCGVFPSSWNGRKGKELSSVLNETAGLLVFNDTLRRCYPGELIASTAEFLFKIAANCEEYPNATVEVECM